MGGQGGGVGFWGGGGQGGCDRRIEMFGKIYTRKKNRGWGSGGVSWGVRVGGGIRVDVNEELKFL